MKRLMNEIAARKAAKNLEELERAKLVNQRASSLNELAKQFETWMAPLIESGELVIQDRFLFRRSYLLHLPNGDLSIEFMAHSDRDEIFMELFFFCMKRSSLTLRRVGSFKPTPVFGEVRLQYGPAKELPPFKPTPVFGVVATDNPSIAEQLAKPGEITEFTQEVLENCLLAVIEKKDLTLVERETGR